ncbi:reverse transcriptase domain-containing protein [Mesorhizobium sp. ES1-1]|uniref:reverse transcriptase domain-containing protein n=1 Tax=Mesorhizobium sp. ES1-1 TaxID=2876629 RepID=UPI001CCEB298|nr:reverse transcriptase domain-containing protein [Mesorhizobium sp. ES1-1]MBZ9675144.1 reverse transcriptase family protein [Mesorhizobium sp. ES1-1]
MPPRSYYNSPRVDDYLALARAFFAEDADAAAAFAEVERRPYIESETHLASYLGISPSIIRQILRHPKFHYRTFKLKKADGTNRIICTPRTYLKVIQWWISDNILYTEQPDVSVHGFCKGRSYITNASAHSGAKHLLNLDIRKFFPSITEEMIVGVFRTLGYSPAGASLLARLTSLNGEAPTGAPTSPAIGNLVLAEFDKAVSAAATANNILYTRYADDLTFSSQNRINEDFLATISTLVQSSGFELNLKKTRFLGRGARMDVTGLVINQGLNLPIEWRNWARGYLQRVVRNPAAFIDHRSTIAGILGVLKSIDPTEDRGLTQKAKSALRAIQEQAS